MHRGRCSGKHSLRIKLALPLLKYYMLTYLHSAIWLLRKEKVDRSSIGYERVMAISQLHPAFELWILEYLLNSFSH